LALAAGEVADRTPQQRLDLQPPHDVVPTHDLPFSRGTPVGVLEVVVDGQVRKQVGVLRDVSDAAQVWRYEHSGSLILPYVSVQSNQARLSAMKSCDATKQGGFPAPGWAEQAGHGTSWCAQFDIELEVTQLRAEACF
jgi:hypothetical protein